MLGASRTPPVGENGGTTMILPSSLIPPLLKILGANRVFVSAEKARERIAESALRPSTFAPPTSLRRDVMVSTRRVKGWPVYTVSPAEPTGTVVYVHGGGWVNEIISFHWKLIAQIAAEARTRVVVPIYPLIPFGTALETRDVIVELIDEAAETCGPIAIAGDSAGGQIALSVAMALKDRGGPAIPMVLIAPALDLTWSNPRIPEVQPRDPWLAVPGGKVLAEAWKGELALTDPAVSPLFGDFTGLGPMQVYSGGRDVLNPDAHLLVERAALAGVDVELHERTEQVHAYPLLPTRVGREASTQISEWLRQALRGS